MAADDHGFQIAVGCAGEKPPQGRQRALGDRVARTSALALAGLFEPVEQRVYRQLALLCDLYLQDASTGTVALNQEVVAGMAGTTRPTVNRVLKQAEDAGLLTLGRGRIDVHDRVGIARRGR